jgi:hypothetical protein
MEIHTSESLVSQLNAFEFGIAIANLERYNYSLGTHQIPSELIKAGCDILRSDINTFIISSWSKEELP